MDTLVATCRSCNAVYDLSGRKARGLVVPARDRHGLPRLRDPLPSRFKIEDDDETTRISWRWSSPLILKQLLGCVLLDVVMLLHVLALMSVSSMRGKLLCSLFMIPMVVLAVLLTYDTLAKLVNSTTLAVSRNRLSIRHGPIPWRGNLEFRGRQLTQLYGKEVVYTSDNEGFTETTITYDLMALDRDGKEVRLLTALEEKAQVLYLEQLLERRLGIEDAPVDGEVATRTSAA